MLAGPAQEHGVANRVVELGEPVGAKVVEAALRELAQELVPALHPARVVEDAHALVGGELVGELDGGGQLLVAQPLQICEEVRRRVDVFEPVELFVREDPDPVAELGRPLAKIDADRLVGMRPSELGRMVLLEAVVVGVVGTVLGALFGIGIYLGLQLVLPIFIGFHDPFRLDPSSIPIWGATATVLVVAAATWPAWRTARVEVLTNLQYE